MRSAIVPSASGCAEAVAAMSTPASPAPGASARPSPKRRRAGTRLVVRRDGGLSRPHGLDRHVIARRDGRRG